MKAEWRKITDRSKTGSGLSPENEPDWYKVINCVLSETNSEINLSSNAGETSFCEDVNESNGSDSRESEDSNGGENESDNENVEIQAKGTTLTPESRKGVNKLVVAPHNKRTQVRSNRQALSEMAHSMKAFAEAQVKRHKLSLESEERREKMQMQFRREESEKNRQHGLKMARIYAESFRGSNVSRPDTPYIPASFTAGQFSQQEASHVQQSTSLQKVTHLRYLEVRIPLDICHVRNPQIQYPLYRPHMFP